MKKGKVHPSPPLLPPSSSGEDDPLSVFKLLPAAILVLVSVLAAEDREVLAYLITRSLTTTVSSKKKKRTHKAPMFDCGCFNCYISYWSKWDSSPNRELIHQIIEAFEDHLTTSENSASHKSKRNKNRSNKKERSEEPQMPTVTSDENSLETGDETGKSLKLVTEQNKGLARKVLPDVLGFFNSRFLSFWNPNA